jgi:translocation and assembly module TamB
VSASPDVVVLDPADPEDTGDSPLDMDLTIALGDDVKLAGFGLDGSLGGRLRVRARPGREMIANGRLDVDGRYTAYGQKLQITRGELVWSNGPVADPILNIRAEREVGEVTAGIDVTGRAASPEANVWSNPASSQSEALSYLALGRPLSSASGDESRQLNAASAALSAGGSLLASQLGARIGLDDAGVMESRALGGSVFGVGKFLSPRLYVGYGVSLLGTGQVLTLKYLLRKGFDIEIESSTIEDRASVNWRKEK